MNRFFHIPPLDRIEMNIVQFLPQHLFTLYKLRMAPLFPELIVGIGFMGLLKKRQQIQYPCCLIFFQIPQNFLGGERLEVMKLPGQIRRLHDTMHMIFQNHITIDFHAPILLPPDQGIEDDLYRAGSSEDGKPVEHGEGQEMRRAGIGYGVAAPAYDVAPLCRPATQAGMGSHAVHGNKSMGTGDIRNQKNI